MGKKRIIVFLVTLAALSASAPSLGMNPRGFDVPNKSFKLENKGFKPEGSSRPLNKKEAELKEMHELFGKLLVELGHDAIKEYNSGNLLKFYMSCGDNACQVRAHKLLMLYGEQRVFDSEKEVGTIKDCLCKLSKQDVSEIPSRDFFSCLDLNMKFLISCYFCSTFDSSRQGLERLHKFIENLFVNYSLCGKNGPVPDNCKCRRIIKEMAELAMNLNES